MRGEDGVACLDHVPGVLDALFTGDCVCTTAVHDDSACSPARFLEDITGNKNGGGTERVEGEASSSRGRMGRSGQDKCEIYWRLGCRLWLLDTGVDASEKVAFGKGRVLNRCIEVVLGRRRFDGDGRRRRGRGETGEKGCRPGEGAGEHVCWSSCKLWNRFIPTVYSKIHSNTANMARTPCRPTALRLPDTNWTGHRHCFSAIAPLLKRRCSQATQSAAHQLHRRSTQTNPAPDFLYRDTMSHMPSM